MSDVECEYKDKCSGKGFACGSCKNNKGKKNYYEPEPSINRWYYDPYPDTPSYEPWHPRRQWYCRI